MIEMKSLSNSSRLYHRNWYQSKTWNASRSCHEDRWIFKELWLLVCFHFLVFSLSLSDTLSQHFSRSSNFTPFISGLCVSLNLLVNAFSLSRYCFGSFFFKFLFSLSYSKTIDLIMISSFSSSVFVSYSSCLAHCFLFRIHIFGEYRCENIRISNKQTSKPLVVHFFSSSFFV